MYFPPNPLPPRSAGSCVSGRSLYCAISPSIFKSMKMKDEVVFSFSSSAFFSGRWISTQRTTNGSLIQFEGCTAELLCSLCCICFFGFHVSSLRLPYIIASRIVRNVTDNARVFCLAESSSTCVCRVRPFSLHAKSSSSRNRGNVPRCLF